MKAKIFQLDKEKKQKTENIKNNIHFKI